MTNRHLSVSCECASVIGSVELRSDCPGNHIICYCKDCQAFQKLLSSKFNKIDSNGGSEVYQTYPALYNIRKGKENIRCFEFSEKGIFRWYTSCCNTHLANTLRSSKVAFVGIPVGIFKLSEDESIENLGEISLKAWGKYANPERPVDTYDGLPKTYLFQIMPFMLRGMFKKLAKPHPFFKENGEALIEASTSL